MNEREFLDLLRYYFRKVKPITKPISQKPENGVCLMRRLQQNWGTRKIFMHLTNPKASSAKKRKWKKFLTMQNTWPTKHSKRCSRHGMKSALTFRTLPVQQHLSLPKRFLPFAQFCPYSFSRPRCLPFIYYLCILLPLWMRIPYRDSTR